MRRLRKCEYDLIVHLLNETPNNQYLIPMLRDSMVEELNDGGMGSLTFIRNDKPLQRIGNMIGEISLLDKDKVPVSFAILLDSDGDLYELDVFKADSSPLIEFPLPPYNRLPPAR
jgi:hypothetical protein